MRTEFFHPRRATTRKWAAYHRFRRAREQERRPAAAVRADDVAEAELTRIDPSRFVEHAAVYDGEDMVGFFALEVLSPASPEYPTGGHIARLSGAVLAAWRRRGVATTFLPTALRFLDVHRATVLQATTVENDGKAFLTAAGFEWRATQALSRLDLRTVDWAMVRQWRTAGEEASPEVRAHVLAPRIPVELRAEVSAVFTMLVNESPFDDLEHGQIIVTSDSLTKWYGTLDVSGSAHATCLLRDADGTILALTDVVHHRNAPTHVGQRLTAVRRDRRGRGLAKWVKAVMLEHLRSHCPTVHTIATENSSTNARMLAINRRLGFRTVGEKVYFQIGREDLRRRLSGAVVRSLAWS